MKSDDVHSNFVCMLVPSWELTLALSACVSPDPSPGTIVMGTMETAECGW